MIRFIKSTIAQLRNKANFILLRLIFLLPVVFSSCGGQEGNYVIEKIYKYPTDCQYECVDYMGWGLSKSMAFSDSCGKYKIGDTVRVGVERKNY